MYIWFGAYFLYFFVLPFGIRYAVRLYPFDTGKIHGEEFSRFFFVCDNFLSRFFKDFFLEIVFTAFFMRRIETERSDASPAAAPPCLPAGPPRGCVWLQRFAANISILAAVFAHSPAARTMGPPRTRARRRALALAGRTGELRAAPAVLGVSLHEDGFAQFISPRAARLQDPFSTCL